MSMVVEPLDIYAVRSAKSSPKRCGIRQTSSSPLMVLDKYTSATDKLFIRAKRLILRQFPVTLFLDRLSAKGIEQR